MAIALIYPKRVLFDEAIKRLMMSRGHASPDWQHS
jgi:hypothetical protein